MYFTLLPKQIRKNTGFEGGVLVQTLNFVATMRTGDKVYEQFCLADGRKLDSLPCSVYFSVAKANEIDGFLFFETDFVSTDSRVSSQPDRLFMEVRLPTSLFSELWSAVGDGIRIKFLGKVTGRTSEKWDISDDQNRQKRLESIEFTTFKRLATDTESMMNIWRQHHETATDSGTASGYTANIRREIVECYAPHSQMRRLCLKAIDQAQTEAVLQGWYQEKMESLAEEAIALIKSAYAATRLHESGVKETDVARLWHHQNLLTVLTDSRCASGQWNFKDQLIEIACALMAQPWLRVDELEWLIVDALTFHEVFEFNEAVKASAVSVTANFGDFGLRRLPWQRLKAYLVSSGLRWYLLGAAIWMTWELIEKNGINDRPIIGILASGLAVLFFLLISFPIRKKFTRSQKQDLSTLWNKMTLAYTMLGHGHVLSPNQIRAALLAAQNEGAVWDAAIFALLDRAARRDPPIWEL